MFNSIEFDDYVVAGLGNRTSDNDQWPAELPADVRSQVVAIVQAPNWDELPQSAMETLRGHCTFENYRHRTHRCSVPQCSVPQLSTH